MYVFGERVKNLLDRRELSNYTGRGEYRKESMEELKGKEDLEQQ